MEKGDELGLRREKDRSQFVTCSESPLWARSVLAGLQWGDSQVKMQPVSPSQGAGSPRGLLGAEAEMEGCAGRKGENAQEEGDGGAEG